MGGSDGRGSVIHPALPDTASALLSTPLDPSSPTPLYHQIYVLLRAKILDQRFGDGDLLPSEAELASSFAVSRITAKRALDEVAAAGLAVRRRGRGTIVTHAGEVPPVQASMDGLMENLLQMGLNTDVRLITFDYVSVPVELSSIFKPHSVGTGHPSASSSAARRLQHAVRVRSVGGKPFSHLTTYVPEEIGRSFSAQDLAEHPLLSLLERSGVKVGRADQTLSASIADPIVAKQLEIEIGNPLLRITRLVFDVDDNPIEHITALYRPDLYQYRMALSRVKGHGGNIGQNTWSTRDECPET